MQQLRAIKKQAGMTMISWVVVLAFIGFQAVLLLKIAPTYFDDASIAKVFSDLESDPSVVGMKPKMLRDTVMKRLKVNNVYGMKPKDIVIKKAKGGYLVSLEYEPREKIMGSLSFVMEFKHEAKVRSK